MKNCKYCVAIYGVFDLLSESQFTEMLNQAKESSGLTRVVVWFFIFGNCTMLLEYFKICLTLFSYFCS